MIRLEAEKGIALSCGLIVLLAVLTVINFGVGNYYVGSFNLACLGASVYLLVRWIEVLKRRRRLGL